MEKETQSSKLKRLGSKKFAASEKELAAKDKETRKTPIPTAAVQNINPKSTKNTNSRSTDNKEVSKSKDNKTEESDNNSFFQLPSAKNIEERGKNPLLAARAIRSENTAVTLGIGLGSAGAATLAAPVVGVTAAVTGAASLIGGISGVDGIATWAAVDNFSSSITFQMNDVMAGVNEGSISPEQAINLLEQAQTQMDTAQAFVDESTRRNPILWPARKRYMATVANNQESLDLKKLRIEQAIYNKQLEGGRQ